MALVALSMTVYDSKDVESTITLYTSDAFSFVTLTHALLDLVPIIGQLINGGLRPKATVSLDVDLTESPDYATYDTPISDAADVEEGLFYQFNTTEPRSIRSGRIPTILESVFISGTREVDLTDTDWLAFQVAMISGLSTTDENDDPITVLFNDQYTNDLVSLRDAYEQFQGSRKR